MTALAQSSQVALLFQQLQSPETTDRADATLRERSTIDAEVKRYLAANLPALIGNGPSKVPTWNNAVRLAGDLRIVETIPELAKWIGTQSGSGLITLARVVRLEEDPAGRALAQIGDPALPAEGDAADRDRSAPREVSGAERRDLSARLPRHG